MLESRYREHVVQNTVGQVVPLFPEAPISVPHPAWSGRGETLLRADLARAVLELPYAQLVELTYSFERLRERENK